MRRPAGILLVLCLLAFFRAPALAAPQERAEVWTGSILTATVTAGVCFRPDGILRGVFLLKHKNGAVDVYHMYGGMSEDGEITARHGSGHSFTGRFEDDGTVKGSFRLSSGLKFSYTGRRRLDAPVTDDCAPLPERP